MAVAHVLIPDKSTGGVAVGATLPLAEGEAGGVESTQL